MENLHSGAMVSVLEQAQHHHVMHCLEGLLPPIIDVYKLKQVLDVNCHGGAWAVELALAYPGVMVTGLDSDPEAIEIARHKAMTAQLQRVRFYEANLTVPLKLQDETFDLVHLFTSQPLFHPNEWPHFLHECKRVLKPTGVINLVNVTLGPGSSHAYQRFCVLIDQLWRVMGYGFSDKPGTATPGVYFVRMLNEAGFNKSSYDIRPINLGGWNNPGGKACYQLFLKNLLKTRKPLIQYNLISGDEFDALIAQTEMDIVETDFCAMVALISAFAVKR